MAETFGLFRMPLTPSGWEALGISLDFMDDPKHVFSLSSSIQVALHIKMKIIFLLGTMKYHSFLSIFEKLTIFINKIRIYGEMKRLF
jgi:hypothetical protein